MSLFVSFWIIIKIDSTTSMIKLTPLLITGTLLLLLLTLSFLSGKKILKVSLKFHQIVAGLVFLVAIINLVLVLIFIGEIQ